MRQHEIWRTHRRSAYLNAKRKWLEAHPHMSGAQIIYPLYFRGTETTNPTSLCKKFWVYFYGGYIITPYNITQDETSYNYYESQITGSSQSITYNLTSSALKYLTNYLSYRRGRGWPHQDPHLSCSRTQIATYLCSRFTLLVQNVPNKALQKKLLSRRYIY